MLHQQIAKGKFILYKMTKQEKVQFVIDKLEEIFPQVPVPLDHSDPYTLLIAVLLSAQCTDERVNKITPLLFAKANNPSGIRRNHAKLGSDVPCRTKPLCIGCLVSGRRVRPH